MRQIKLILYVIFLLTITPMIALKSKADELPEIIYSCTDAKWPPYSFQNPDDNTKCFGVSPDILKEIFKRQNIKLEILIKPWLRCVKKVKNSKYHIMSDASRNPEREKTYLISNPVYKVRNGLFYMKSKYPNGPGIKKIEDVNQFTLGSIFGYNLDIYKFDTSNVDSGAKNVSTLIKKLQKQRFDLAVGYVEVFQYYEKIGEFSFAEVGWINIPETRPLQYYYMLTRDKTGQKLLKIINNGLEQIKADGTYKKILNNYGISVEEIQY